MLEKYFFSTFLRGCLTDSLQKDSVLTILKKLDLKHLFYHSCIKTLSRAMAKNFFFSFKAVETPHPFKQIKSTQKADMK